MKRFIYVVLALVGILSLSGSSFGFGRGAQAPPAASSFSVVVEGLHSPRGLSFGPGDILYVAQAGDENNPGSIIQIPNSMSRNANYRTMINGVHTLGGEGEFIGLSGISVLGRGANARIYAIMGESPQATGDNAFGSLLSVGLNGSSSTGANVGEYDFTWTGDHSNLWEEFPDANPYGVLAIPGHIYVTDAGANTLNEVMADGSVRVLAYFPNEIIRDAIPTCVAQGPDGALYVGTLAFVDSAILGASAKVYRVQPELADLNAPWQTPMTLWASGLWPINGCAFGPDGTFFASQLYTNPNFFADFGNPRGDVVKVPFNDPSSHTFLANGTLSYAGGLAVGPNGKVFVADGTAYVPNGRVLRFDNP